MTALLNESEHKRQETLHHNTELLTKLKQKEDELVVLTNRINQMKGKKAKYVLKDEYEDINIKLQQVQKLLNKQRNVEQTLKKRLERELQEQEARLNVVISGLQSERLGFLNQVHSLK